MFTKKIASLQELKSRLINADDTLSEIKELAVRKNNWFTNESVEQALDAIIHSFLDKENLSEWLSRYKFESKNKTVGLILAGNIPLVGFHDILCCYVLDLPTQIKVSSKDEILIRYVVNLLKEIDVDWQCDFVERLKDYDAVIATGSANTNRYFEEYFKKVPSLLRSNRTSIAILSGEETDDDLLNLADDIFQYSGLGCRNVSKLYIPENFDVRRLFPVFEQKYKHYFNHRVYMDNYDYNRTLLLMNGVEHLSNEFLILKEDKSLHARLATVHYEKYDNVVVLKKEVHSFANELQCIVGVNGLKYGTSQSPRLWDYADKVNTLQFLLKIG